ncbi:hypothetical protein O3P69_020938 [Scylla paramamosain]|uniref:Uncharacterized protein n=1 Tax=Scylla paramamosain TaxID=85552 RepID=A0AAW0SDP8_SCYPA
MLSSPSEEDCGKCTGQVQGESPKSLQSTTTTTTSGGHDYWVLRRASSVDSQLSVDSRAHRSGSSKPQWAQVTVGHTQVRGHMATVHDLTHKSGYHPSGVDTEVDSSTTTTTTTTRLTRNNITNTVTPVIGRLPSPCGWREPSPPYTPSTHSKNHTLPKGCSFLQI